MTEGLKEWPKYTRHCALLPLDQTPVARIQARRVTKVTCRPERLPDPMLGHHPQLADAYGLLPEPSSRGSYRLSDEYITTATDDVAQQLSKAGVRLAFVLNKALRR